VANSRGFGRRAALVFAILPVLGGAGWTADIDHGEQLARRWCAACHVVADDQTRGADNVPTFAAIAKQPNFKADEIARFLRDPHPKMPDMQLTVPEAADLAAYIAALAK